MILSKEWRWNWV